MAVTGRSVAAWIENHISVVRLCCSHGSVGPKKRKEKKKRKKKKKKRKKNACLCVFRDVGLLRI